MLFQKNYKANLTATLQNTNSGEVEVKLSIETLSDTWFLLFEPGTVREETCFFHRKVGTSVFIYWVNRDNPVQHIISTAVMLTNSIDGMNYIVSLFGEGGYIFKKDTFNIIVLWWNYFIDNILVVVPNIDTSVISENQNLFTNATNYIYIKNWLFYIKSIVESWLYLIWTIIVNSGGVITSIVKNKFSGGFYSNSFAPLDNTNKIPFSYLPSIFSNIQNYASIWAFPSIGQVWIIYTVTWSSISYRWSWSAYVVWTGAWDLYSVNNLSDLPNKATARTNLNVYSTIEDDALLALRLLVSNNLSDLPSVNTARTNLNVYSKTESDNLRIAATLAETLAGTVNRYPPADIIKSAYFHPAIANGANVTFTDTISHSWTITIPLGVTNVNTVHLSIFIYTWSLNNPYYTTHARWIEWFFKVTTISTILWNLRYDYQVNSSAPISPPWTVFPAFSWLDTASTKVTNALSTWSPVASVSWIYINNTDLKVDWSLAAVTWPSGQWSWIYIWPITVIN